MFEGQTQDRIKVSEKISIVPTIDEHLPVFWRILQQWPEIWEGNKWWFRGFKKHWKTNIVDSLTGIDNGKVVMCGCLDRIYKPAYATIIVFKERNYSNPEMIATLCKKGLPYFFENHDIEAIRAIIREDLVVSLELAKSVGLKVEGTLRNYVKVKGVWFNYTILSILRGEINGLI